MKKFIEKFGTLIGLNPIAPNCIPAGMQAAEITATTSGIYLSDTDTLNLNFADAMNDCDADSIWVLLSAARRSALQDFQAYLVQTLGSLNRPALPPFVGAIGGTDNKGVVPTYNGQVIAVTIKAKNIPGAYLKIKQVGLFLDANADVRVSISGQTQTVLVVASAGTPSMADVTPEIEIPLEGQDITFSYTVNNFRPKANKLNCNCSGMQARANNFFTGLIDSPAQGLLLDVEVSCSYLPTIYNSFRDDESVAAAITYALLYKTLEKAVERIQNSGRVSRYTMMESEYLWGKRNNYRTEYQNRINWLVAPEGIDISSCSCFECRNQSGVYRRTI